MSNDKKSSDVVWHHATVTRARRQQQNKHKSVILWFTGLSGAGKSTLAHCVEEELHQHGCSTFVLDGDNVRHGLCGDLGFTAEDRNENIRRIAEVAKLMLEAGVITLTAFISPFREEREKARLIFPHGEFLEIYCRAPLEVCEQRDVKGLYARAREGKIKDFTGISAPFEEPVEPDLEIRTDKLTVEQSVKVLLDFVLPIITY